MSEEFTDDYSNTLLGKEWLVRVDNANSIPYLFKYGTSEEQSTYFILVTDTKTVWTEVLTRKQLIRRWRLCNPSLSIQNIDENHGLLRSLLGDAHIPAGVSDANLDIIESRDADLAFEIDFGEFKWLWDTYRLGPKTSADVISRHLILPLISLAHVSFYSADPVSELGEGDLEKIVDRIGRSARRSVDIHVKQTIARPKIATTLQRISSLFALHPALPSIQSEADAPDFKRYLDSLRTDKHVSDGATPPQPTLTKDEPYTTTLEMNNSRSPGPSGKSKEPIQPAIDEDSATESESDDDHVQEKSSSITNPSASRDSSSRPTNRLPEPSEPHPPSRAQTSDSTSPPTKRLKKTPGDSSDSESDSNSQARGRSQGSQGSSTAARAVGRGVRQPIKRGGRRF